MVKEDLTNKYKSLSRGGKALRLELKALWLDLVDTDIGDCATVVEDKVVVQETTDDKVVYFPQVMENGDACKEVYSRELPINIVS